MPDAAAETNPTGDQTRIEEQLVAYLDGELDDADARRIEELLASDAEVRQTLEKLEATWGLLDHLDQAHVDEGEEDEGGEQEDDRTPREVPPGDAVGGE